VQHERGRTDRHQPQAEEGQVLAQLLEGSPSVGAPRGALKYMAQGLFLNRTRDGTLTQAEV